MGLKEINAAFAKRWEPHLRAEQTELGKRNDSLGRTVVNPADDVPFYLRDRLPFEVDAIPSAEDDPPALFAAKTARITEDDLPHPADVFMTALRVSNNFPSGPTPVETDASRRFVKSIGTAIPQIDSNDYDRRWGANHGVEPPPPPPPEDNPILRVMARTLAEHPRFERYKAMHKAAHMDVEVAETQRRSSVAEWVARSLMRGETIAGLVKHCRDNGEEARAREIEAIGRTLAAAA